jgi:MBG domain-containing protein
LTITYSGFKNSDTAASLTTQPTASTAANDSSPIGNYPITVSGGVSDNYNFTYEAGTLTINPKLSQSITFNALSAKVYGDADFAPGATASSGLPVTYASSNTDVATIIGDQIHIVGAGTTTITASQAGDATFNPAVDVTQSLAVNKAAQTISFSPSTVTKTYGNADFSSIATTSSPLAVTYDSSDAAVATVSPASGLVHIVGAGSAAITANLAGDANHDPASAQLSLTVDKTMLTVSAANASRPYGTANPTFTPVYGGFVNGESATVLTGAPELTTIADINSPVGSYPITASVGTLAAANYTFSFGPGTLAVDLASQTITFDPLTARIYGDASFDLAATGGASGNPVTYTSSDEAVATISGATVTIVGAGTTTITASQAGDSNYASATTQQNLVVDKKVLNVTAQNESRPYNTVNPAFTAVYAGFVAGESATAPYLTGAPDFATIASITSPVGSYDITASIGTLVAANYTFAFGVGTLGVDVASQNITFDPLAAKTYGDTAFDLAATGGASGNPVTFASSNEAVATVSGATVTIVGAGTTTITASQAGNSNYASATAQQNQVVIKAPLTVSAQPVSRDYGTDNPTLVPAYIGFVSGETAAVLQGAPDLATSAVIDSPAGSYPISVATGNLFSSNYTFAFVPGALTVSQASQAITVTTPAPAAAAINSQFTVAAIAPGGTVTYSSGSTGVCTNIGDTFTMIAVSGNCIVQYDQAGNGNYLAASQVTNSVTADKASQTIGAISFTPASLAVSGTTAASAVATSGLAVSFSSTTPAICTVSGSTVSGISAGTCTIIASQAGNASYNAAPDVTGVLTVTSTDATLTVTTAGSGNGMVNSNLGVITCPGDCTETLTSGTPITLYAAPDWKSDFAGWSGACSGIGDCDITMDTGKVVTATFNVKQLVRMPGPTYYATLQEAYNAASNGGVIEVRDQTFAEDLVFNRTINVTLAGGKDDTFTNPTGYTSVNGSLSIVDGSVTIGNLIIQ